MIGQHLQQISFEPKNFTFSQFMQTNLAMWHSGLYVQYTDKGSNFAATLHGWNMLNYFLAMENDFSWKYLISCHNSFWLLVFVQLLYKVATICWWLYILFEKPMDINNGCIRYVRAIQVIFVPWLLNGYGYCTIQGVLLMYFQGWRR